MTFSAGLAELGITPARQAGWEQDLQAALAAVANDGRFKVQSAESFLADASVAEDPAQSAIVEHVHVSKSSDIIDAEAFADEPDFEPNDQIPGILPTRGTGQLFGPSGAGKSFAALKMAADVALGADFHNGRTARQGAALYVVAEGQKGFKKRIRALRKHYGVTGFDGRLKVLRLPVNLFKPSEAGELVDRLRIALPTVTLVVFDTKWRCSLGAKEDSADDTQVIFGTADYIARELKCFCLLISHTGYDTSRVRGSSSQYAACDVELSVAREGDHTTIAVTKNKDDTGDVKLAFKSEVIDLGRNRFGESESSLVLEPVDAAAAAVAVKLPKGETERALWTYAQSEERFTEESIVADVTDILRKTKPKTQPKNVRRTFKTMIGEYFTSDGDEFTVRAPLIRSKDWLA